MSTGETRPTDERDAKVRKWLNDAEDELDVICSGDLDTVEHTMMELAAKAIEAARTTATTDAGMDAVAFLQERREEVQNRVGFDVLSMQLAAMGTVSPEIED